MLDIINIMAYDAGPTFRPLEAYAAYRSYFPGSILIGLTSPPEAWGGHEYSLAEAVATIKAAMERGAEGAVVFAIGKQPPSHPSAVTPPVGDIITALIQTVRGGHTGPRRRLRNHRAGASLRPTGRPRAALVADLAAETIDTLPRADRRKRKT